MDVSDEKVRLIRDIKNRLLISGRIEDHELAEEIARRWVCA